VRLRTTLSLALALAVPAAAACGGDDKPSKDEFVEKADAICKKNDEELEALGERIIGTREAPTPEKISEFSRKGAPLVKETRREIADLEPPEGDEEKIDKILAAVDEGIARIERAGRDPEVARDTFREDSDPFAKANRLANDYGLKECGDES
jgi:hypothetical protein